MKNKTLPIYRENPTGWEEGGGRRDPESGGGGSQEDLAYCSSDRNLGRDKILPIEDVLYFLQAKIFQKGNG